MSNSGLQDKGWDSMSGLLDEKMPVDQNKTRTYAIWIWLLIFFALASFTYWFSNSSSADEDIRVANVSKFDHIHTKTDKLSQDDLMIYKRTYASGTEESKNDLNYWQSFDQTFTVQSGSSPTRGVSQNLKPEVWLALAQLESLGLNLLFLEKKIFSIPEWNINDVNNSLHDQKIIFPRVLAQIGNGLDPTFDVNILVGADYPLNEHWYMNSSLGLSYFLLPNQYFSFGSSNDLETVQEGVGVNNDFNNNFLTAINDQDFSLRQYSVLFHQSIGRQWNAKWSSELFGAYEYVFQHDPIDQLNINVAEFEMPNRIVLSTNEIRKSEIKSNLSRHYLGLGARLNYNLNDMWALNGSVTYQRSLDGNYLDLNDARGLRFHLGLEWRMTH